MKMFILKNCPHCKRAITWIEELKNDDSSYQNIQIEIVDEQVNSELANQYDYYYVPAIFDGSNKLHEGVVSKDKLKIIFNNYLKK